MLVGKIDARPVVLTMASMAMLMARQRVKMRIDEFAADAVLRNDQTQNTTRVETIQESAFDAETMVTISICSRVACSASEVL